MLKVNGYGGRQAKVNEKSQCFKGWETLVRNNMIIVAFALYAVLVYITVKSVWGLFKNWKEMDFKSCLINITISIISVGGFTYILWKQKAIQDVIEFIKNI